MAKSHCANLLPNVAECKTFEFRAFFFIEGSKKNPVGHGSFSLKYEHRKNTTHISQEQTRMNRIEYENSKNMLESTRQV